LFSIKTLPHLYPLTCEKLAKAKVIYHQGHGMGNVDYNSKMGFSLNRNLEVGRIVCSGTFLT